MTFIARYIHRRGQQPEYFRTVYGDTLKEAMEEADKYARNGYICAGIKQKEGAA